MLAGLARDGGRYVPDSWPVFAPERIAGMAGMPYSELALEILRPFVGSVVPEADLARMTSEAYGVFRHPAVVPLVQLGPRTFVLELFHGPTLAFKDLAMQLLARLMDHVLRQRGERATVICATSGDTGGAAVEAFRGCAQVDVVVLFPKNRISDVQRKMMTSVPDSNVHALAIEGTFDDCQAVVKGLFAHASFRDSVRLSAVVVDVARGLVLLYGIGTSALPSWDPRMGRSNLMGGLAGSGRQVQADMRTHHIHRPARDSIPPPGGTRASSYWNGS